MDKAQKASHEWFWLTCCVRWIQVKDRSTPRESRLSRVKTHRHETHPDIIQSIYAGRFCHGYRPLWCLSPINIQKTAHESERKRCCRTCPWIIRFLSFLQHQSHSVTVLCISTDTLKTWTAHGQFGVLFMVPVCWDGDKYWPGLKENNSTFPSANITTHLMTRYKDFVISLIIAVFRLVPRQACILGLACVQIGRQISDFLQKKVRRATRLVEKSRKKHT